LAKVAGLRWTIEENFHVSKGLTGLDEHQARRWTSWYRMRWSRWRRHHQHRARACHYQRQTAQDQES
jgi:hypothetical protein